MHIEVTSGVMATLCAEADRAAPEECCGLLLGRGGPGGEGRIEMALPAANVSDRPRLRFEIDPAALLAAHKAARAGGPRVLGYYHSHPTGHPVPSAIDCEHSTGDLRIWAIIASGQVAFWRDSGKGFSELTCRMVGEDRADHI
ncbi:Proteasome lid subunit RPN8/RPN11, contains Jab1/MPN metalloenzyme (JAMM) motif [Novosphingobium sp. CF614]|uniref:Mov34/MPN/PAD-1 family protein n=1 Tax=Novosphingobium sp. CF614 TaxID=1884364 RepID=UPI0008F08D6F|nr:Mov34/MPN/PAD-1 family protein [Novosphingobium sp. CF614]SFG09841.1 Proteasome lid subunit RPN8/RPN11, contains Jab1/MPN metalloenzyme (JAMM) motif [Novosphingobium sp. CF614]